MATTPVGVWGRVAHPLRLHRRCMGPLPRPIGMVCAPVGAVGTVVAAVQLLEQVRRGGLAHRDGHAVLWHERGTVSPARLAPSGALLVPLVLWLAYASSLNVHSVATANK